MNNSPVITIDGPSGVGKGTATQKVAEALGFHILDSGALYRLLAMDAQQKNIALDDEAHVNACALNLDVQFLTTDNNLVQTRLNGQDVSIAVRSEEAGKAASQVAVLSSVRATLLVRQHQFLQAPGLVADGRDMGTVVFPSASLKIFLTASVEERAKRRYKQLKEKGISANIPDLVKSLTARDGRDSQRAIAPLQAAVDALIIDTSDLSIDDVVEQILKHWKSFNQ
jgi:cytidylate kinase